MGKYCEEAIHRSANLDDLGIYGNMCKLTIRDMLITVTMNYHLYLVDRVK